MELFGNLGEGFGVAFAPINLLYALVGCFLGLLVGVLPGMAPVAAMALLLPWALTLPPAAALILLVTLYLGTQYGGAISAILFNRSGESASPLVHRDGHAMARHGRFGPALAAAGISAAVAGVVVTLLLATSLPVLSRWGQIFGAPENLALMVLALVGAVALASGKLIKGLAMGVMGVLLSLVGTDAPTGLTRFALDLPELNDGIGLVALAMGLFVYGEMLSRLAKVGPARAALPATVLVAVRTKLQDLRPTRLDGKDMAPAVLRGGALGTVLGLLPGGGLVLAAFAARGVEKANPPEPGEYAFGQGNIRGVASPEAAHSAAVRSSFLPLLALGIPSNAVMALLLGAMSLQHLHVGPTALTEHPEVLWGLVVALGLGSVLLVLLQLPLLGLWSRLLALPYRWLVPGIVLLSALGMYSIHHRAFDIWLLAGFGVLGYVFHLLELDPAPLLLGYILGPAMEDNLRNALQLSDGDWSVFVTHPLSAALLTAAVSLFVVVLLPVVQVRREEAFIEDPN